MFPHLPIYLANYISKYKYICTYESRNNGWSTEAMAIACISNLNLDKANFSFAQHFGSFISRVLHELCSTKSNIKKMPSQIFSWPNITSWLDWLSGVLRRTVVSDWRFDNLRGSHLQSQVVVLVSWKLQGFWIFNWLTLPLDSEDGFRTGCRSVSH